MKRLLILTFLFLFVAWPLSAQNSIESLREEIRRAEEEIRQNTALLEKARSDQKVSESELKLIQSRIRSRRDMINTLDRQIKLINGEINANHRKVTSFQQDLDKLKKDYASMVRAAYKNYKLNSFLLFLFAAEDFNDATRRVEFMRRYNRSRTAKAGQINAVRDSLAAEIRNLGAQRAELDETKRSRSTELAELGKDEKQYSNTVAQLRDQQDKLSRQVRQKQQLIDRAQKEIEELIAAEARKNATEVRSEAEDRYITELSGKFDENKGKLPYPIRNGVIIDRYGRHQHPTQKGLIVNNKGVNVAGDRNADVICVFEGTVTRVFSLPGYNNCVMIRHGDYITLYANLASVSVKQGESVAAGRRVGRISSGGDSDDLFVHFEVWHKTNNLNPEQWLRR